METTSSEAFFQDMQSEFELWRPKKYRGIRYKRLPLPDHDVRNCEECHKAKVQAVDDFNATLGYKGAPRAHECGPFADPAAKRVREDHRIEAQRFGVLINARCQEWKGLLKAHNDQQHAEYQKALKAHNEKSRE